MRTQSWDSTSKVMSATMTFTFVKSYINFVMSISFYLTELRAAHECTLQNHSFVIVLAGAWSFMRMSQEIARQSSYILCFFKWKTRYWESYFRNAQRREYDAAYSAVKQKVVDINNLQWVLRDLFIISITFIFMSHFGVRNSVSYFKNVPRIIKMCSSKKASLGLLGKSPYRG